MQAKPTAKYIIYWCVYRYLTTAQVASLKQDLGKNAHQQRRFLDIIRKYLDIESLRTNPVHPMDILVYNYLMYDFKGRLTRNKLLKKYEQDVMMA